MTHRHSTPKRSLVHIVQHLVPGGIESMALEMLRAAPADLDVHIISLEGEKDSAIRAWPRLAECAHRLHFLEKKPGVSIATWWSLVQRLRQLQAEVIHTHHIGPLLYGASAARLLGIHHRLHTEHDAWHLSSRRRRQLMSCCLQFFRPTLVADAELVANAVQQAIPRARPAIIHNGIDTESFQPGDAALARQRLGLAENVYLIGCAARLEWVKGVDVAIAAMASLPDDYHLAIAGQGSQREALDALAKSLGVASRVHFLGLVNDMPTFYRALDIFCLPSRQEGLPLSILEAQSCGIPALATRVGGCAEALCPQTGQLVAPEDPALLASALMSQRVTANEHATPPRVTPREFVVRHRDLRVMSQQYLALLNG